MKNITIALAALMVVGIMLSGVALGAQTSFDVKVDGNVFVDEKYQSQTHNGLPYAGIDYNHKTALINVWNTTYVHSMDSTDGLETTTELKADYKKGAIPASVLVDESFTKSIITSSLGENSSATRCYSSGGGFSAMSMYLDFESATVVSDMSTGYGVTATGLGSMQYTTSEYEASGDVNGTWMTSVTDEDVRAYGAYIFEGTAVSEATNFPASFEELVEEEEEEERLCPFGVGWD